MGQKALVATTVDYGHPTTENLTEYLSLPLPQSLRLSAKLLRTTRILPMNNQNRKIPRLICRKLLVPLIYRMNMILIKLLTKVRSERNAIYLLPALLSAVIN